MAGLHSVLECWGSRELPPEDQYSRQGQAAWAASPPFTGTSRTRQSVAVGCMTRAEEKCHKELCLLLLSVIMLCCLKLAQLLRGDPPLSSFIDKSLSPFPLLFEAAMHPWSSSEGTVGVKQLTAFIITTLPLASPGTGGFPNRHETPQATTPLRIGDSEKAPQ